MQDGESPSRRRFLTHAGGATLFLAGCLSNSSATIADTRVAWDDGSVGVYVELRDANQNEAGPVTVHAELVDGEENVLAERDEEFDVGGRDQANVIVWFEEMPEGDRDLVEGARAEVVG